MRAYLWTPLDLVRLDLEPLLGRERRRLRWHDETLTRWRCPLPAAVGSRTRALVQHLEALIEEARRLPSHDARAAKVWIASLERRAARLRGRWPAWLFCRVADSAAHRLLPQRVLPLPGQRLPGAVGARADQLRRADALVVEAAAVADAPRSLSLSGARAPASGARRRTLFTTSGGY
jgi:hypothetical protein